MNKTEHDKICREIRWGKRRNLEHQISRRHGTILACTEDGFDVTVDGENSHWATQNTELNK
jgi:hypothetical protein